MSVVVAIVLGLGLIGLILLPLDLVGVVCLLFSSKSWRHNSDDLTEFIGKIGAVAVKFSSMAAGSTGRVEISGTTWAAELAEDSEFAPKEGDLVKIIGRRGLTLLVVPTVATLPIRSDLPI